jgi:adenosylcobinamide-GDP ribazoletransferase
VTFPGDAARLAVGTFTALPAPAPRTVDARRAGLAMAIAPGCGALLGGAVGAVVLAAMQFIGSPLTAGVAGAAASAAGTRALHLDGLADAADAWGSGRRGEAGIAVMRRSDIGPFGVVSLVLVLLAQTAAWTMLADGSNAALVGGTALAYAAGRCGAVWACRASNSTPVDGLSATFLGTVPRGAAIAVAVVVACGGSLVDGGVLAVTVAVALGIAVVSAARRRFGRVTGDSLGASIEAATTAALVLLAAV